MYELSEQNTTGSNINLAKIEHGLRLDILVRVRWLTIVCQSITLFIISAIFHYPLSIWPCAALILLSIVVNLYLKLQSQTPHRLNSTQAAVHLGFDILQLIGLLYLTGGLLNPFSVYLLAPVLISATSLDKKHSIFLGGLVVFFSFILVYFHHPLPWAGENPFDLPTIYIIGIWVALTSCLFFMGYYAFWVANEARKLSTALAATELVLAREQHLSMLDGLAAAAAHELGTPLSTIAVVVRELKREWPQDTPLGADLELISSQSKRCKEILGKLTSLSHTNSSSLPPIKLSDLLEEIAEPHRNFGIEINVLRRYENTNAESVPMVLRIPGVLYGLGNLLENAVDFAKRKTQITIGWTEEIISIKIEDDGPGFSEVILEKLGEPYVTSRRRTKKEARNSLDDEGLGLGIFIAKTLLERSGASVTLENRALPDTGAKITLIWPQEYICFDSKK